jgi:hypothetical protein
LSFCRHSSTIITKGIDINMIQKIKYLWNAIFTIDSDAIKELKKLWSICDLYQKKTKSLSGNRSKNKGAQGIELF